MTMHNLRRPEWTCALDDQPWPCPTRRSELMAEFADARVSLIMYLGGKLVEACQDRPAIEAGALYRQVLGWARPAIHPARPIG